MSTRPGDNEMRELRNAEIDRLSKLRSFPSKLRSEERGVLLSDRIKYYCEKYKLIAPFDNARLRPAGYDLRVGHYYSIGGETTALNDGMKFEIEPYRVAIIETYETINMPEFLIGRWNIRVGWAYKGLLWVGGAQVDPGFRGHLCCPIYNLSTETVTLGFGEDLAMIDFVTTTPYEQGKCKRFDWANRKKLVFPEYTPLNSGIAAEVNSFKKAIEVNKEATRKELESAQASSERSLRDIGTRIDTFLTLIFTVVAVLFAGLGIVATKGSNEPSFLTSPVLVAAVALYFALRAYVGKWFKLVPGALELVITVIIVLASLFSLGYHARISASELQQAKEQASQAMSAVEQERRYLGTKVGELRQQSDAKLESLQQQINRLQQKEVSKK